MAQKEEHPVNFADCYVLTDKRTKQFISSFLERFIPNREEYTNTYEVPELSDNPAIIFNTADQLIDYLAKNKNEVHGIYWANKEVSSLRGAMCLFTNDEQIIIGVFCETLSPDISIESNYLNDLKEFSDSTYGIIQYEVPAPRDTKEFMKRFEEFKKLNY